MRITVDDREVKSGIAKDLAGQGWELRIRRLSAGDYRLGDDALIERKTASDFVLSIIDGRLFRQAARLRRQPLRSLLLVEGDPFQTEVDIDPEAVRGAIVSLSLIWQMPVLFSESRQQTVRIIGCMTDQVFRHAGSPLPRPGYRPKRTQRRQLFVLQGFPGIGQKRAANLLHHFRTLRRVFQASLEEFAACAGIGKEGARKMTTLLDDEFAEPGPKPSLGPGAGKAGFRKEEKHPRRGDTKHCRWHPY